MRLAIAYLAVATVAWGAPVTLKIRLPKGVVEMDVEHYVASVLAGECSTFRSDEAIKAMAVAARSYGLNLRGRHTAEGYDLCSTTHCQRVEPNAVTERLASLAAQTSGELLWFAGKPAFACYSKSCGGHTEDGGEVWSTQRAPYLRSHADPYCTRQSSSEWHWTAPAIEIAAALRFSQLRTPAEIRAINVLRRNVSGRVRELELVGDGERVRVAASSLRFAIGRALGFQTLRSDLWQVAVSGGRITFTGTGDGHGAGLCQLGADQMGSEGHGYREILAFYYPGAPVGVSARGLQWRRMGGESVSLMTTQPDGSVLPIAERLIREITHRYGWTAPAGIEIRVYPDVETFRNATGEPGWVAARTTGRRIELQPAATLRGALDSTLRHELLHVFVGAQSIGGLPVWFREGVVGYLENAAGTKPAAAPEVDIRQTDDAGKARRAYAAAARRVADLAAKYGEASVLAWLRTGLPPEVK
ncbi:MAG: SpoIID/LytB domain-containing protein [Candidatus Solibacter sp.]